MSIYQASRHRNIKTPKRNKGIARCEGSIWIALVQQTGAHLCALFQIVFMDVTKANELVSGPGYSCRYLHCPLLTRNIRINLVSFVRVVINSQSKWRSIVLQTRIFSLQPTFVYPLGSRGGHVSWHSLTVADVNTAVFETGSLQPLPIYRNSSKLYIKFLFLPSRNRSCPL